MIKNYLRTTVTQERLGGLAVLPIEKDDIDYSNLFAEFAARKSRKVFSSRQGDSGVSVLHKNWDNFTVI